MDDDGSFQVKLASSGRIVLVPKDKTGVEALAAAGIEIEMSCEPKSCSTYFRNRPDALVIRRPMRELPQGSGWFPVMSEAR